MRRHFFAVTASALVLAACATTTEPVEAPVEPAVEAAEAVVEEVIVPPSLSRVELAMGTVDELVAAGNTQTALDRLTQLLGDASLTEEERGEVLMRRGFLRSSEQGYDLWGGIEDLGKVAEDFAGTELGNNAQPVLATARGRATSLNAVLERPESTRTQRFDAFMALGQHDDALELMLSSGLQPNNDQLVAFYQIGHLCIGEDQTGPVYNATEPDGTERELRFCDFGK